MTCNHKLSKSLTCICLILNSWLSHATNFYISNKGNDNNNGMSAAKAWQTLSKVENAAGSGIIKAGDSILFKRGDTFTGTIRWTTMEGYTFPSGRPAQPITFAAYDFGTMPVFLYPKQHIGKPEERVLLWFTGVDYIVIDGLRFTDTDTMNNKINGANCGIPIYLGTAEGKTTNHCTVKNVDISLCGMGVVIIGDFNTVTNSIFSNFKNLKSTPNTGRSTAYDDYGANGITITGNDNEISHNYISGAWAESLDFGWNGGAIEMYNTCMHNKIIHNNIIDCGGVAEFGGQQKSAVASDNLFANNLITNCGTLSYCNLSGEFNINVSNVQYFENKIIENSNSRFTGPKTGAGITTAAPRSLIQPDKELFAYNGVATAKIIFNLKDNIFDLSTGISVARKSNDMGKYIHENNVYHLTGGSETNFELNFSEREIKK